jgi:hypothetical protein
MVPFGANAGTHPLLPTFKSNDVSRLSLSRVMQVSRMISQIAAAYWCSSDA